MAWGSLAYSCRQIRRHIPSALDSGSVQSLDSNDYSMAFPVLQWLTRKFSKHFSTSTRMQILGVGKVSRLASLVMYDYDHHERQILMGCGGY